MYKILFQQNENSEAALVAIATLERVAMPDEEAYPNTVERIFIYLYVD